MFSAIFFKEGGRGGGERVGEGGNICDYDRPM